MLIDEASFLTTGAALPQASRTLWTESEKLHQRLATVEVNAGSAESEGPVLPGVAASA